jgi:arginase
MPQRVWILGIPMDLGQQRRGVDMGASAVRYAGFHTMLHRLGYEVCDAGNMFVPEPEVLTVDGGINARYLPDIVQVCHAIYAKITADLRPDDIGVFIGGDHSLSIGTVNAIRQRGKVGVLWVDAHGDFNTPETSPSGNVHGMALAALVGDSADALTSIGGSEKLAPAQVAMIGVRDLDVQERPRLKDSGISVYTMRELDEYGMAKIADKVVEQFKDCDAIHVSLDLDACDPQIAPGVGTPVPGGLTYREAHLLMEILADSGKVRSVDVVEINPILDTQNRTAHIAVELLSGLLGQKIM